MRSNSSWSWGISGEQWLTLLHRNPGSDFGVARAGQFDLANRIEYCFPVAIGEVMLDHVGVLFCCFDEVWAREFFHVCDVVSTAVGGIATLNLKENQQKCV